MPHMLGAAFLRCSLDPLHRGGRRILASQVKQGLHALSSESLHEGFQRGIAVASQRTGVHASDVESLLPMDAIAAATTRLRRAHRAASTTWRAHAGHLGGLMMGVAELTLDSRSPDACMLLRRLSSKLARDPELAESLAVLATELDGWRDLMERSASRLDGGELARIYQRRRSFRVGMGAALAVVSLLAIAATWWVLAAQARMERALSATDPCAPVDDALLAHATAAQHQRAADRRAACDEARRKDAARLEEQRRTDEQARAEQQRRHARIARCNALAENVAKGALGPEDDVTAGPAAALLARVARGRVDRADLTVQALPCDDTSAGATLVYAFAAAVVASPTAWARPDDVAEPAFAALVAKKDTLPGSPRQVLAHHADNMAKKSLIGRDELAIAKAQRLCKLAEALGIRGGKFCATLERVAGKH